VLKVTDYKVHVADYWHFCNAKYSIHGAVVTKNSRTFKDLNYVFSSMTIIGMKYKLDSLQQVFKATKTQTRQCCNDKQLADHQRRHQLTLDSWPTVLMHKMSVALFINKCILKDCTACSSKIVQVLSRDLNF